MSIQEPTPIVPPQEPLKGRDPTLAQRTMGESYVTDTGDVVNRVVLPPPLVGYYESVRLASVTFHGPFTVDQENVAGLRALLTELFAYPDGVHTLHSPEGPSQVSVASRTSVVLHVGAENEDVDLVHLHTLLSRLKGASHVIEVVGSHHEPRVRQAVIDAGFETELEDTRMAAALGPEGEVTHVSVPYKLVWRRNR